MPLPTHLPTPFSPGAPSQNRGESETTALISATDHVNLPEFIRLPRGGTRDPITGLSRSALNSLILPSNGNGFKPPVKSVCLRKHGAARGIRLIVLKSLLAYIHGQADQEAADENGNCGPITPSQK